MLTNSNYRRYAKATAATLILLGATTISVVPSISVASGLVVSTTCTATVGWQTSCS